MKTKHLAPLAMVALLFACGEGTADTASNATPGATSTPAIGQSNVVDD